VWPKENSSTVHPFFIERTLRNWKITTRPQLFFFFPSSSRRHRSPVLQAEQRFDQPPTSPFQIKEQTPSIGKLQDILSERPSAVGTLIWPLILRRTTAHPDKAEYSTSSTDKQLRRARTETAGSHLRLPEHREKKGQDPPSLTLPSVVPECFL